MSIFQISRYRIIRNGRHPSILANFSDDSSKKDKDSLISDKTTSPDKVEDKAKNNDDAKKVSSKGLNDLLAKLTTNIDSNIVKNVAKPKSALVKKERRTPKTNGPKEDGLKSDNIFAAEKKVAENTSPDKVEDKAKDNDEAKKLSSKRLNHLLDMMTTNIDLNIVKSVARPKSALEKKERRTPKTDDPKEDDLKSDNIFDAAKKVAETIGGDAKKTESELLRILLKGDENNGDRNLSSIIGGMKVDKANPPFERRSDFVKKTLAQEPRLNDKQKTEGYRRPQRDQRDIQQSKISGGSVDLFGAKPLGIFTNVSDLQDSPDILPTWNYLRQRELKMAVTHPPRNYFEKMALWTEQGKLWKFPIDNEQGMDDEAKNYFTEHVFLDKHLEPWCPTKGPVRHFMELVCVGLSKNPYYTVAQKREHIEWFRDYFAEKMELLESVIADSSTPKELEK